jgi:hypothetical protein
MEARTRPPWAWPALAALSLAVLLAPFFVVDVPAVLDYPNHLARFYFLAHPHDPWLSRYYAPHWAVLPNLGLDLIGEALAGAAPIHVAGRIVLALSLVAPLLGAALYARAAFGRWTWWSLGAGVIAFNGAFFMGFMNFLVSIGLALASAAAWRVLTRRAPPTVLALTGALLGLAVFFCHLLGFAFFGLLVGAQEAEELLRLRRRKELTRQRLLERAAVLTAALGPSVILYVVSRQPPGPGDELKWEWSAKVMEWLMPFITYDRPLTALTALVVLGAVVFLWRGARRARGAGLALALLALTYGLAPFAVAGGSYFDCRMPVMAGFLLFAGFAPQPSARAGALAAAAFAALLLLRSAEVATNWWGHAEDLAEFRRTIAAVEPGAPVIVAETRIDRMHAGRGRVLQGFMRLDRHLPALLLLERRAFWPLFFSHAGQQPVRVLPPYDRMSAPSAEPVPWYALSPPQPRDTYLKAYPYLADWRGRFEYVLAVGPPPQAVPPGLRLLRTGAVASLYRIDR